MKLKIFIISIAAVFVFTGAVLAEESRLLKEIKSISEQDFYTGEFSYIIGPGDVLEINVWRHPDLTTQARVRPDGKIAFPLIDEVYVGNVTPEALKKEIATKLSTSIRDPRVTVNVLSFQSKKLFVLGEVNRPGVYPFEGRVSVLDALSKAGGYNGDTAALKSVIVIKRGNTVKPQAKRVNILDVITKGDVGQDIFLGASDIVFVPKTFISNLDSFIDRFITKTDPVLRYYLDIIDIDQRTPGGRSR
jgi:polysaccharide export outer membrane protein